LEKEWTTDIRVNCKMSFFNKIYEIAHTDLFKYVFHSGSDKVFVANVCKITTFDKDVLDSKWTLTIVTHSGWSGMAGRINHFKVSWLIRYSPSCPREFTCPRIQLSKDLY